MTQHWKLVPAEPTPEMWAAVNKLDDEMAAGSYDGKGASIEQIYNCMVDAAPTQTDQHYQWPTTVAQMKLLGAELIRAAETMGGDDEESHEVELVLAVAPAGTVQDDDGVWNGDPILTVRLEEYPEEGVYPVDPRDPTGGRIDAPTPPASAQDDTKDERQAQPIKLVQLAVAEDGGVRFITGRKLPDGIESCELYAMPDYGRAPAELFHAPAAGDARAWQGLTDAKRDGYVGELVDYGTDFVAPLYSVVESIEKRLREKNAASQQQEG